MKNLIEKTKSELIRDIENLRKLLKAILGILLTIALLFPWTAIFLSAKVNIYFGIISFIIGLCFIKFLKDRKIL